jgi:Zn ribbon nucleic-acid-binding protein
VTGGQLFGIVMAAVVLLVLFRLSRPSQPRYGEWDSYAICPGCDAKFRAPFGNEFHVHFSVCPECGHVKGGWQIRTMRPVSRWGERVQWETKE